MQEILLTLFFMPSLPRSIFCPRIFTKQYFIQLFASLFFLGGVLYVMGVVSFYNDTLIEGTAVGDLFFSIIPLLDLSPLYYIGVWVTLLLGVVFGFLFFPKHVPFIFFAYGLLFLARTLCLPLTHLAVPETLITPNWEYGFGATFFNNDLFFSGHTSFPFFSALLFWSIPFLRYTFLWIAVVMAFTVLSMRMHYSIDIVGAVFISFGVFHFAHFCKSLLVKYQAEQKKKRAARK